MGGGSCGGSVGGAVGGLPRSISDTKLRQGRPNLTLPLPSVTSLMHFKVLDKKPYPGKNVKGRHIIL